jgi:hypothetical protein
VKKKDKKPKLAQEPPRNSKKAKARKDHLGGTDHLHLAWHISMLDRGGRWGWNKANLEILWNKIYGKLVSLESMTWNQLSSNDQGSHLVPLSNLCSDARDRLEEIKQNDIEHLYSLRLSGKERIWGIRKANVLKILWWDPDHEVCPSLKKHT